MCQCQSIWLDPYVYLNTEISVAEPDHFGVTGVATSYGSDVSGSEPDGQNRSIFKHQNLLSTDFVLIMRYAA
jgi:hypothetical protein